VTFSACGWPSGGEGAKQWMTMLTELRNRGLVDALIVCCDGLKGLPDAIRVTWPPSSCARLSTHSDNGCGEFLPIGVTRLHTGRWCLSFDLSIGRRAHWVSPGTTNVAL
jgi:hypothetical protein